MRINFLKGLRSSPVDAADKRSLNHAFIIGTEEYPALRRLPSVIRTSNRLPDSVSLISMQLAHTRDQSVSYTSNALYYLALHTDTNFFWLYRIDNWISNNAEMSRISVQVSGSVIPYFSHFAVNTYNGQIIITDIDGHNSYVVVTDSGASMSATTYTFPGTEKIMRPVFMDGFFFYIIKTTAGSRTDVPQKVGCSPLNSATSLSATSYALIGSNNDYIVNISPLEGQLYIFCAKHIEVWYNAGLAGFPLLRNNSAHISIGLVSVNAIYNTGDAIYFIGVSDAGRQGVYCIDANGLSKVSNEYIDSLLASYGIFYYNDYNITGVQLSAVVCANHVFITIHVTPDQSSPFAFLYDTETGLWIHSNAGDILTSNGCRMNQVSVASYQTSGVTSAGIYNKGFAWLVDQDGYYQDAGTGYLATYGFTTEWITGEDDRRVVHKSITIEIDRTDTSGTISLYYTDDPDVADGFDTLFRTDSITQKTFYYRGLGSSRKRRYRFVLSTNYNIKVIGAWFDGEQLFA